jgi:hypothetical protein
MEHSDELSSPDYFAPEDVNDNSDCDFFNYPCNESIAPSENFIGCGSFMQQQQQRAFANTKKSFCGPVIGLGKNRQVN